MANIDSGVETECESSDNSLGMESAKLNIPEFEGKVDVPPEVFANLDMSYLPPPSLFVDLEMLHRKQYINTNDAFPSESHQNKMKQLLSFRREARRWTYLKNVANLRNILDERKLRLAASWNNTEMVERLLKKMVNPRAADAAQRTALHIAASKGYTDTVKLLLDHGANPNQKDIVGNTPLHLAVCSNHVDTVTLLLKAGTNVHSSDKYGRTPMHLAQSKLKLMQDFDKSCTSDELKNEVLKVIDMLQVYLKKSGQRMEAELVNTFATRLNLTQTKEEVDTRLRELLSNLSQLSLHKTES